MARLNRFAASGLVSVVQVNGKNHFRINRLSTLQHFFQHFGVGVVPNDTRELDDDRRASLRGATKQTVNLFKVADVVSSQRKAAISGFQEFKGGDAHEGM